MYLLNELYAYCLREGQPVSPRILSHVEEKNHARNLKHLTPPLLGPKKNISVTTFRVAMTLDVKILGFWHQVAVCVKKWRSNAIFGCSQFQNFNFVCLLLLPMICTPKNCKPIKLCVSFLWSVIRILGTQIYSPLFLASRHKSWS